MKPISNELLREAMDKAEEFCKKLSFEFYWDFAEVDKEKLRETVALCFATGYLKAKE
jgi:hypothetical protein